MVIGVKPQIIPEIAESVQQNLPHGTPLPSIAAGTTLDKLHSYFGENSPIIRSMPNLPASIGKGISASVANDLAPESLKNEVKTLLSACGAHIWTDDEAHMDVVTAISGSGPAYVFHFIEILNEAAENAGLPKEFAKKLARQTVIGSAALAEENPDTEASTLRENVTSRKGTTEAGLEKLMDGRFSDIINETVQAAKAWSKELSE